MLKDVAKEYYLGRGLNCAESIFLASNNCYNLWLDDSRVEVVIAFSG